MDLDKNYWNERYRSNNTPWDIGYISSPLKDYIDRITDKAVKILIPGAGRAYEAAYLYENGFVNVFVCDWAEEAFVHLLEKCPDFPRSQILIADFFSLTESFDLIIEQTFFCALQPVQREKYVEKINQLLNEEGHVIGLLFASRFDRPGPPFGGNKSEYLSLFSPYFEILEMEMSPNSILPRSGNELFFRIKKKQNNVL
ncbi:MAG: SAM-dependent methyltransferase [Bacteroidota bacterium]